mmetsp:Transcript_17909/g.55076  ORF Transcript_17909/g.55076 Transcript_17909/m.55076 type:complete len:135 (-) Transcript_17909:140-544(-)
MASFAIDWFGVVLPGLPVLADFRMVDAARCATVVERCDAAEVCFFLTHASALPPDRCAVLYYSADGVAWSLLGTLHLQKPSGLFRLPPVAARAGAAAPRGNQSVGPDPTFAKGSTGCSGTRPLHAAKERHHEVW